MISLQFKGLSGVFSNTTVGKHQFFGSQPSLNWYNLSRGQFVFTLVGSQTWNQEVCGVLTSNSTAACVKCPRVLFFLRVREGNGTPLQNSCLENPMDGAPWWAPVHGVAKSQTRLSDFTFTFHLNALEKEMATHSSVLAWRILGTGELGGLPSMGSHRVGHN